jgi:hypothetical protein
VGPKNRCRSAFEQGMAADAATSGMV